jgi:transposase-like protein
VLGVASQEVISHVVEILRKAYPPVAKKPASNRQLKGGCALEKAYTAGERKTRGQSTNSSSSDVAELIRDRLEELACEGAQRMLAEMLEAEVNEFLQRVRYERGREFRGYRNGHAPERTIGVGLGALKVRMPRVSDVPKEVAPEGFQSEIVGRYQRISRTTQRLLARLYLEGLSTGDFEPVFRAILGESAPLSATSITRLKTWGEKSRGDFGGVSRDGT